MLFARPDKGGRLNQPEDHIDLVQCPFCHRHHIFPELVFRLMDSRCVQENDLAVIICINGLDPAPGRLWFIGCDRDFLTDQLVH